MAIGVRTIVEKQRKAPGELRIVTIDFSEDMATGETLTAQNGPTTITPTTSPPLTSPAVAISGQTINIHLAGGLALETYKVSVLMTTSTTQELAAALIVPVRVE